MKIAYIHGANATGDSFNYIRTHITGAKETVFDYNSDNGFYNNLEIMEEKMRSVDDVVFVCHSLGGIYALHLANLFPNKVLGAITISTPYGGAESADYTRYFLPFNRLLKDIGPGSQPIRSANQLKIRHPWTQIVTTKGDSPWILEPNDGVVSIASMTHRKDMTHIPLEVNHYEVVINLECVGIIKNAIKNLNV